MTYSHVRYAETELVKEMRDDVRVVYGPSVNPPESRARHTLAATFLLAFAMLFAAALPAQAQTTIWSATLDPLVTFSGDPVPLGCDNTSGATWQCSNSDRLSDDDFTDDGTTYAVTKFFSRDGVLTFRLDMSATAATQGLTLVIDGEGFVLKEANQINGGKTQWKWTNTTLGWTAGTDVAVSLVVIDAPATGQPTISGAAQVNKTLTAATDDIEDPEWAADEPHVYLPVDAGGRLHRHRHPRGDLRNLHADRVRSGQADQDEGEIHRRPGPRRGPAHERRVSAEQRDGGGGGGSLSRGQRLVRDDDGWQYDGAGFGYEFDKSGSLDRRT